MLRQARLSYYSEKILLCESDPKNLFKVGKHLFEGPNDGVMLVGKTFADLAQAFSDFFINNIDTIRNDITSKSKPNVKVMLARTSAISCKESQHIIETARVPAVFKSAYVRPLLKKTLMEENTLKNYRLVPNLPFLYKVLKNVVSTRMEDNLAYRKFHSTETAQNDILHSLDQNNETILVMLDLSAAFETINHNTLQYRLEHLFGIKSNHGLIHHFYADDSQRIMLLTQGHSVVCSAA